MKHGKLVLVVGSALPVAGAVFAVLSLLEDQRPKPTSASRSDLRAKADDESSGKILERLSYDFGVHSLSSEVFPDEKAVEAAVEIGGSLEQRLAEALQSENEILVGNAAEVLRRMGKFGHVNVVASRADEYARRHALIPEDVYFFDRLKEFERSKLEFALSRLELYLEWAPPE
ncbi:MAG TPA: hypothetical protein VMN36_17875 [Verrucomicrobiales bacterium]|nr:hypothetical protein [Verrucomicrobiales bacterium]